MTEDEVKELVETLLNNYMIIAHDGDGVRGEHYFVQYDELNEIITDFVTKKDA